MSGGEGSEGSVEKFKGACWSECETFIQAMRERGWKEGKLRDPAWMADFASLHFSSEALKWHSFLSLDVRHDWYKLEMALVERWGKSDDVEKEEKIPTIPTPAPAFSVTLREDNAYSLGVLRFMPNIGEKKPVYIGPPVPDGSGECTLTTSIEKALQFRYDHNSPSNLRILESLGDATYLWLAVHWNPALSSNSAKPKPDWARVALVDASTLRSSRSSTGPVQIMVWDINPRGPVAPMRKVGDECHPLSIFCYSQRFLCITADPLEYSRLYPDEAQGRLIFHRLGY